MRVGVALCTFNGEAYLQTQLTSLSAQSRRPDVVCVSDDGSTDSTSDIVARWSAGAPFEVRFVPGPRKGPTRNFENASAQLFDCDVILFCDQDDLWLPDKVVRQVEPFVDPRVTVSFCNAGLMGVDGRMLPADLWTHLGFQASDRVRWNPMRWLVKRTIAFGLTMGVRTTVLRVAQPAEEGWGHDNWAAVVAAAMGRAVLVDACLVRYRQHEKQVSGGASLRVGSFGGGGRFAQSSASYEELASRVEPFSFEWSTLLRDKGAHLRVRERLVEAGRMRALMTIGSEAATRRYHRFSNGIRSMGGDVLRVVRRK